MSLSETSTNPANVWFTLRPPTLTRLNIGNVIMEGMIEPGSNLNHITFHLCYSQCGSYHARNLRLKTTLEEMILAILYYSRKRFNNCAAIVSWKSITRGRPPSIVAGRANAPTRAIGLPAQQSYRFQTQRLNNHSSDCESEANSAFQLNQSRLSLAGKAIRNSWVI